MFVTIIIIYWYVAAKSWISKQTIKNKHTRKVQTVKCEDKNVNTLKFRVKIMSMNFDPQDD